MAQRSGFICPVCMGEFEDPLMLQEHFQTHEAAAGAASGSKKKEKGGSRLREGKAAILPPAIEGWLTKRGHRNKRSWKTRWFEAYPGFGGCIKYYKDETKTKLIGTIPLSNATVRPAAVDDGNDDGIHMLVIVTGKRVWEMAASSSAALDRWLAALGYRTIPDSNRLMMEAEVMILNAEVAVSSWNPFEALPLPHSNSVKQGHEPPRQPTRGRQTTQRRLQRSKCDAPDRDRPWVAGTGHSPSRQRPGAIGTIFTIADREAETHRKLTRRLSTIDIVEMGLPSRGGGDGGDGGENSSRSSDSRSGPPNSYSSFGPDRQWHLYNPGHCLEIAKAASQFPSGGAVRLSGLPYEVRWGVGAVSKRLLTPPSTGMIEVQDNGNTRVVRVDPNVAVATDKGGSIRRVATSEMPPKHKHGDWL